MEMKVKMETASLRLQYKVGLFVAFGLIVLMLSILALGGNRVVFKRYLAVQAEFTQVQGLFAGSVVSLAGIPVGNVKSIRFVEGDNRLNVVMQIDRDFAPRLRQGTTAEIRTQGALGDKYVYLEPGPPAEPQLQEGAKLVSIEDDIFQRLTSKEDGVGRALELIKEMHLLVASLNANNRAAQTAENLKQATAQMRITMTKIDGLVGEIRAQLPKNQKLREAVDGLASIVEKIDSGKGSLGALINDPSLHQSLKSLVGNSPRNRYMKEVIRESIQQ